MVLNFSQGKSCIGCGYCIFTIETGLESDLKKLQTLLSYYIRGATDLFNFKKSRCIAI